MCLFSRYVSQKKFSELEGMLFDGAILLFSHQETASGVNRLNLFNSFNMSFPLKGGPCQVVRRDADTGWGWPRRSKVPETLKVSASNCSSWNLKDLFVHLWIRLEFTPNFRLSVCGQVGHTFKIIFLKSGGFKNIKWCISTKFFAKNFPSQICHQNFPTQKLQPKTLHPTFSTKLFTKNFPLVQWRTRTVCFVSS